MVGNGKRLAVNINVVEANIHSLQTTTAEVEIAHNLLVKFGIMTGCNIDPALGFSIIGIGEPIQVGILGVA